MTPRGWAGSGGGRAEGGPDGVAGAVSPAGPSWSTTRSTWSTPAPQRTSTWSSRPHSEPGATWRGTSEAAGFGKDWIGGMWDLPSRESRGLSLLTPQGLQRESCVPRFPSDLLSLCVPPSSVCLCPPCLQTRPSALHLGSELGGVWRKARGLGDWHQAPRVPPVI